MGRKKKTKTVTAKQKKDGTKLDRTASQSDTNANDTNVGLNNSERTEFTSFVDDSDLAVESDPNSLNDGRIIDTPKQSGFFDKNSVSEASSPIAVAETVIVNLAEDFSPVKKPTSLMLSQVEDNKPTSCARSRAKLGGVSSSPGIGENAPRNSIIMEEETVIEHVKISAKRRDSESSEDYDYPVNDEIEQINIEEMIGGVGPSTDSAYLLYDSVLNSALRSSEVGCNIVIEACDVDELYTPETRLDEAASVEFDEIVRAENSSLALSTTAEAEPLHVTKKEGDTFYSPKARSKVILPPETSACLGEEIPLLSFNSSIEKNYGNTDKPDTIMGTKSTSPFKVVDFDKHGIMNSEGGSNIAPSITRENEKLTESFIENFDVRNTKQCIVRLQDCLNDDTNSVSKTPLESVELIDISDIHEPVVDSVSHSSSIPVNEEEIASKVSEMSLEKVKTPVMSEVKSRPCRTRGASRKERLESEVKKAEETMEVDKPLEEGDSKSDAFKTNVLPFLETSTSPAEVPDKPMPFVPSGISIFKLNHNSLKSMSCCGGSDEVVPGVSITDASKHCEEQSSNAKLEIDNSFLTKVSGISKLPAVVTVEPVENKPCYKSSEMDDIEMPAHSPQSFIQSRPRRQTRQPKRIADAVKPKATTKAQASKVTASPRVLATSKRANPARQNLLFKSSFNSLQIPDSPVTIVESTTVTTLTPPTEPSLIPVKTYQPLDTSTTTSNPLKQVDGKTCAQSTETSDELEETHHKVFETDDTLSVIPAHQKLDADIPHSSLQVMENKPANSPKHVATTPKQLSVSSVKQATLVNLAAAVSKSTVSVLETVVAPPKQTEASPVAHSPSPKPTAAPTLLELSYSPSAMVSGITSSPVLSPPILTPYVSPKVASTKPYSLSNLEAVILAVSESHNPLPELGSPNPVAPVASEPALFTPDVAKPVLKPPAVPILSRAPSALPTSPKLIDASSKTASPKRSISPKQSPTKPLASPKRVPSPKPTAIPKPTPPLKSAPSPKTLASPKPTPKSSTSKYSTPAKLPSPKTATRNPPKTTPSTRPPPVTKAALKAFSPKPINKPTTAKASLPKGAKGIAKAMAKLAMAKDPPSKNSDPAPEPMDIVKEEAPPQASHVESDPNIATTMNGEDTVINEDPKSGKSSKTETKKEASKRTESTRRRSNRIKVNRWDEGPAIAASPVGPGVHGSVIASMPVSSVTAAASNIPLGSVVSPPSKEPSLFPPPPSSLPPPTFETDKPVKVKSRWRRTSELEMGAGSQSSTNLLATPPNQASTPDINSPSPAPTLLPITSPTPSPLPSSACNADLPPPPPPPSTPPTVQTVVPPPFTMDHPEIEERLKGFEVIRENIYLTTRHRSKEAKKMVCECTLSEEEITRGEPGCGEDCLNRLLMIECSNRCVLGDLCSNKRFQNCEYSNCTVVKTEKKGLGLIASSHIPSGEFLMEYVGEVLDPKEFRRRAKEYSKEKNLHFYFMALKSDSIIDATLKGNISRFINHSCDPNAETQKWTCNGELRIGFFSKRPIAENEEVTFDYQLQRYGKEAQRCHCESANCRGWIGEEPDKEDKEEKDRNWEKAKDKREKKKNREELEEEIEKLRLTGIKNRAHTLMLNRLMVRAEDHSSRSQLLAITQADVDQRCLRLFLDYHGLNLLWSWMVDSTAPTSLKVQILDTLAVLPITNKTILQDSKVFGVVERWANLSENSSDSKPQREEDSSPDSEETNDGSLAVKTVTKGADSANANDPDRPTLIAKATALYHTWVTLKEEFRIPKKERIEQMKEHEREADRGYVDHEKAVKSDTSYDRHWSFDKESSRSKRRGRDSPDNLEWKLRSGRSDERNGGLSQMSKMKRRQLFAMKVEEEERQKRLEGERWSNHQEQCYALGVDPNLTYPPQNNGYFHSLDGSEMPPDLFGPGGMGPPPQRYPPPPQSPFLPGQCSPAFPPPYHPMGIGPPAPGMCPPPPPPQGIGPPQGMVPPPGMGPPGLPFGPPPPGVPYPPGGIPLPGPIPGGPPPGALPPFSNGGMPPLPAPTQQGFPAPMFLPGAPPPNLEQPPNDIMGASNTQMSSAVSTVIVLKLPKNWKISLDKDRRVSYYYHTITRHTQWTFPSPEDAAAEEAKCVGLKSTGKNSHADDSDDSEEEEEESESEEEESSSDEYEEKEDEEDDEDYDDHLLAEARRKAQEEQMPAQTEVVETQLEETSLEVNSTETNPLLDTSEPALKKKREGLVTVNIISPRDEEEDYRKGIKKSKIKETKMKLARQKARAKAKAAAAAISGKSKKKAKTCEADTSSGPSRKIKDKFRVQMATVIVTLLNPYRKADCKVGRIVNTEDFKHLARKLTHFVMVKELRHIASIEDLQCNDNVKHKARDFIRKYMSKFGAVYSRSPDD